MMSVMDWISAPAIGADPVAQPAKNKPKRVGTVNNKRMGGQINPKCSILFINSCQQNNHTGD
jgi:hypothetical protein